MMDKFIDIMSKAVLVGFVIVFFPLILALTIVWLITNGFAKKCKYHKVCKLYSDNSETCVKNGGEYPFGIESKYANCYLKMNNIYK